MAEVKMDPLPGSNSISNRNAPKPEPVPDNVREAKKPEYTTKVIAKATLKKKSFGEKVKEIFIGEDIQNVGDYILKEVVVPTIKNTIVDIIQNGISLLIFGESSGSSKRRKEGQYVSYGSYSSGSFRDRRRDDRKDNYYTSRGDYIFEGPNAKKDAQDVLNYMIDMIDMYGDCSVGNYYELIGAPSNYQDRKWGWKDLRYADVRMARGGGYYIDLPNATYID